LVPLLYILEQCKDNRSYMAMDFWVP